MSSSHEGQIRAFYHLSEAWYADANLWNAGYTDEVMIGFYGANGDEGTSGEFGVRWKQLGSHVTPRLEVYDDSWETLTHFKDVLEAMAEVDGEDITPRDFCQMLLSHGLKDLTLRTR